MVYGGRNSKPTYDSERGGQYVRGRELLDSDHYFTSGRHEGEKAEVVAFEAENYITTLLTRGPSVIGEVSYRVLMSIANERGIKTPFDELVDEVES